MPRSSAARAAVVRQSMSFTPKEIRDAVVFIITLVLSIAVHEFGHAFVADKLGDPTPRSQNRVTLNPISHMDLFGTLIIPLVVFFTHAPLLGWGKPVQVSPVNYTRRWSMRVSDILVTGAGPSMNVILALLVTIIYTVVLATHLLDPAKDLARAVENVILLNWSLAIFNLIPCPPLDGGWILANLLPRRYENITEFLQQYGFVILMGLVISGVVGYMLIPAIYVTRFFLHLVYGIAL